MSPTPTLAANGPADRRRCPVRRRHPRRSRLPHPRPRGFPVRPARPRQPPDGPRPRAAGRQPRAPLPGRAEDERRRPGVGGLPDLRRRGRRADDARRPERPCRPPAGRRRRRITDLRVKALPDLPIALPPLTIPQQPPITIQIPQLPIPRCRSSRRSVCAMGVLLQSLSYSNSVSAAAFFAFAGLAPPVRISEIRTVVSSWRWPRLRREFWRRRFLKAMTVRAALLDHFRRHDAPSTKGAPM